MYTGYKNFLMHPSRLKKKLGTVCPKISWPNSYSNLIHKFGEDFSDRPIPIPMFIVQSLYNLGKDFLDFL